MSYGVRAFIGCVFAAVAVSFLVTTGVLVWEYWGTDWLAIASFYSHLFVFFPTFGLLALAAFHLPALVVTDHYVSHVPSGWQRVIIGIALVLGTTWYAGALGRALPRRLTAAADHGA